MKSRTGFAPLIVIAVIAALVIAGGVYFVAHKKAVAPAVPVEERNSSSTAVDTSNWKTYRNEQYGFEFKLPENLFNDVKVLRNDSNDFGGSFAWKLTVSTRNELKVDLYGQVCDRPFIGPEQGQLLLGLNRVSKMKSGDYTINIDRSGSYECYDCTKEERDRSGYAAYICSLNNTACLEIESRVGSSAESSTIYDFFANRLLPTMKIINKNFENVPCSKNTAKG